MNKYSINVQWSDEDECFVALVPEFPGLSAFGDTQEEALAEAKSALQGFIEIYEEDGMTLPEPKKTHTHSGQFRVRIPKALHAKLAKEAEMEGVSLNSHVVYLLSEKNISARIEKRLESIDSLAMSLMLRQANEPKPGSETSKVIRVEFDPGKNQPSYGIQ